MTSKKLKATSDTSGIKRLLGRPKKYTIEHAEKFIESMKNGLTKVEAAVELGIARSTMYEWAKEHKEFAKAFQFGQDCALAYNIKLMRMGALGQIPKYNVTAHNSIMNNMFREDWNRNPEMNQGNKTININNMNVLQDKSIDELVTYIENISETPVIKDVVDLKVYDNEPEE